MDLTSAHLRYLLAIYELSRKSEAVSSSAVAQALRVQKPSVTRMLENLRARGLAEKERYGKIALTEQGRTIAQGYEERMEFLTSRFPEIGLELSREEALLAAEALLSALPERYRNAAQSAAGARGQA